MFEKVVEIGLLFDFYGKLLSTKQYQSIELYYIHDLTLSEIGEQLNISRQGVYDLIKRAEVSLYKYEKTLGLVEKFENNRLKIKELKFLLEKLKELVNINDENKTIFENINLIIEQLLKNNQEVR
ncbi:DNA-binding protein [Clostridium sp. D2Q-14]|uniref:YlxM family DNA-binding protein n=1 Tax=Anaeromonas gelatinilytica TaxID=2683194 RepID=UPI00193BF197|nr:sigma factor-like helix-turn-helix DNA-binding protein [Anaeromonas gelatinilytica]MBS4536077.1 DNA-binding protein [Anaeromonas gelatinilytica]